MTPVIQTCRMTAIIYAVNTHGERMGHSRASKREHHEEIVGIASSRFREDGVDRVGVADLMHDAGLTHGGFYRHFESRDQLVAEGVERALHDGGQAMAKVAESPHDPLAAVIDAYLSIGHRDNLGTSCAVTTLAGDVARSNPRARAAYTDQVGVYIDMLVGLLPPGARDDGRATAITALSTLVGAVSMARAVDDEALSREILASASSELKAALSTGPTAPLRTRVSRRPRG
jgi:TetR/AcrR family transcriptional regulator, transcriptional repressor for nem operon